MSATEGGCLCGNVRISYTGEPDAHVLCHCLDCKKISGAMFSNNVIVPTKNFHSTGTTTKFTKTADSGKKITNHFCPDCGTVLYRTGETFLNKAIIKSGIFDNPEWHNKHPPKGELFVPERVAWVAEVQGAAQIPGMPS